jgi:hypothetical protein
VPDGLVHHRDVICPHYHLSILADGDIFPLVTLLKRLAVACVETVSIK